MCTLVTCIHVTPGGWVTHRNNLDCGTMKQIRSAGFSLSSFLVSCLICRVIMLTWQAGNDGLHHFWLPEEMSWVASLPPFASHEENHCRWLPWHHTPKAFSVDGGGGVQIQGGCRRLHILLLSTLSAKRYKRSYICQQITWTYFII